MSRLSETLSDNNAVLSIRPSYITPEEVVSHVSQSVKGSIVNVILRLLLYIFASKRTFVVFSVTYVGRNLL